MSDPIVRFVPLGGLGEIGMNCFALECGERILVVDCGMGFPDDDLGVDVLHPDFSWLYEREDRIEAIFITHGHEDHIGALPYLIRNLKKVPRVFAPPHASALIRERFADHELDSDCIVETPVGSRTELGPFSVESVAVAHSIIDATALAIDTPVGTIFHTGDFDLDSCQPAGHLTDALRLEALGQRGIRVLLSDSTNIDTPVRKGSEQGVIEALERLIVPAKNRVVVGLFSSNVHRLDGIFRIAKKTGRKVSLLGRSLTKHYAAARAVGQLQNSESLLVGPEQITGVPRDKLIVLAGGSQGEAASSLRRLSLDTHQSLRLEEGDMVILSSRVIPGNEREVFTMQNDLLRLGVDVRSRLTDPDVHTSGHAGRSEQAQMIEWLRPDAFIPVHGTLHHMRKHRDLALELGVPDTVVVENGTPVRIPKAGPLSVERPVRHGITRIAIGGEELDAETRRRRQDLGRSGVAVVALAVGEKRNRIEFGPTFSAFGIPTVDGDASAKRAVRREVERVVSEHNSRSALPLEESIRRAVRRMIQDWTGTRPVVEVHLDRVR